MFARSHGHPQEIQFIFYAERANFLIRPGVLFGNLDARPYGLDSEEKWTRLGVSPMPVTEVFVGDCFPLEAGHGLEVEMNSYPDDAAFGALAGEPGPISGAWPPASLISAFTSTSNECL